MRCLTHLELYHFDIPVIGFSANDMMSLLYCDDDIDTEYYFAHSLTIID